MIPRTKYCFTNGEKVALCYDGKWCRGVEGLVLYVWSDGVEVQFKPWCAEEVGFVKIRCEYTPKEGWGGWLSGTGELGILRMLGVKEGDWYSLMPLAVLTADENYSALKYDREPEASDDRP